MRHFKWLNSNKNALKQAKICKKNHQKFRNFAFWRGNLIIFGFFLFKLTNPLYACQHKCSYFINESKNIIIIYKIEKDYLVDALLEALKLRDPKPFLRLLDKALYLKFLDFSCSDNYLDLSYDRLTNIFPRNLSIQKFP